VHRYNLLFTVICKMLCKEAERL